MDESKFWTLIGHARTESLDSTDPDEDFLDAMVAKLQKLPEKEIAAFHQLMCVQDAKLFNHGIMGALHIIHDGEEDQEEFEGFRGWIISLGREVFARVVKDPDSLADEDVVADDSSLPDLLPLAADVYEEQTGSTVPEDPKFAAPVKLAGEPWTAADLPKRFPRLYAEFKT
jgi:hypothetical protein